MPLAPPTRKLHLAALRRFFDQLVLRHVVILNPALSVRGERYQVVEGRTPEITIQQARQLLMSIDTSHVVGLRDRAVIAVLIYTAVRVGVIAKLRHGDLGLKQAYPLRVGGGSGAGGGAQRGAGAG